jgi:hypothetical protein
VVRNSLNKAAWCLDSFPLPLIDYTPITGTTVQKAWLAAAVVEVMDAHGHTPRKM